MGRAGGPCWKEIKPGKTVPDRSARTKDRKWLACRESMVAEKDSRAGCAFTLYPYTPAFRTRLAFPTLLQTNPEVSQLKAWSTFLATRGQQNAAVRRDRWHAQKPGRTSQGFLPVPLRSSLGLYTLQPGVYLSEPRCLCLGSGNNQMSIFGNRILSALADLYEAVDNSHTPSLLLQVKRRTENGPIVWDLGAR